LTVRTTSKTTNNETQETQIYQNFVNAIRSPATRTVYLNSLKRYLEYLKVTEIDRLLDTTDPKVIEPKLIDYIMVLRNDRLSYATMKYMLAPIFTFYQLNDVILNRKKLARYFGESRRVTKDKAYTTESIAQALATADHRMKMIILLLASTGCRIGALPGLTLDNLTKIPEYGLYKVTFYEQTNNEYYSFTTRECAQAIDTYLLYRHRCGEKISFNQKSQKWEPEDGPLIRLSFDGTDSFQASRKIIPIKYMGLKRAIDLHLIRSGIRQVEHPTEHKKRVRKSVKMTNGFRKYVISTFIEANLNHEIRELLVDHATMLDQNYFRPTQDQVLQEYLKAESLLTKDPSLRLQNENKRLKHEVAKFDHLQDQINEIARRMRLD
jgi:integrase